LGKATERPGRAFGERNEVVHDLQAHEPGQLVDAAGIVERNRAVVVADRLVVAEPFGFELRAGVGDGPGKHVRTMPFDGEHDGPQARRWRRISDAACRRGIELSRLRQAEAPLHFFDSGHFIVAVVAVFRRRIGAVFALKPSLPVFDFRAMRPGFVGKRHFGESP
jgi:hypothetical protein